MMFVRNEPPIRRSWSMKAVWTTVLNLSMDVRMPNELLEGTPVLRIQNLTGGDRWYYSNLKLRQEKILRTDGDLLFAWSASFGPYIWKGPRMHFPLSRMAGNSTVEIFDKKFAYYLLGP